MRRKTPCFAATQDQLVASGIQPDRHGLKQGLWESAANVYFANGKVRRKLSPASAFTVSAGHPIRGIGQLHASDGGRWLWGGAFGSIYRWQFGSPASVGTIGTYQADQTAALLPTLYDFTPYGDWMIVNDSIAPKIFKPGSPNTFNAWAGEVPQGACRYMKVLNMIMAIGYGLRGTQVGWCDPDNIDVWTATSTNLAGSLAVDEFDTPVRAAAKLADRVVTYAEDSMAFINYIGGSNLFGFKPGLDGIGAVGKQAVASDTRVNVGMSRRGAWWTDGNTFRFIDEGFIQDYFQQNINWAQAAKICVSRNDATGCFEFHYPKIGSNTVNEAMAWDPRNQGWSPLTSVGSSNDERRLFDYPILGGTNGAVYLGDFDYSTAAPLSLSTKPIMLTGVDGNTRGTHIVSYVDELELWLQECQYIEARVGNSDDPNGTWNWDDWRTCQLGSHIIELGNVPDNPLWKVQFRNAVGHDTDWRFNLQGLLLYGPEVGTKKEA